MLTPNVKIFTGSASKQLGEKIAASYGQPLGTVTLSRFSDGEFQPSFEETVRGSNVFLIQSTNSPVDNLFELLMMIDAAKRASAKNIIAVIPYFGFARQDRKDQPRVPIGSKLVANLLMSAGANRIITMDLHADQIQGFFEVPIDHLYSSTIFLPFIKKLNLRDLVIVSPDIGGSRRANAYAKFLGAEIAICYKQRKKANVIESITVIGEVEGRNVILVDDIVDTASTLSIAANMLMDKGAISVRTVCTHAVLSGDAYQKIEESKIQEMIVTDTIPIKQKSSKIKVISVADLFANVIDKVLTHESISAHFIM
ncbi:MAG: ribose-phosphate pyrophosphokinase [Bacteroidota bacterium]